MSRTAPSRWSPDEIGTPVVTYALIPWCSLHDVLLLGTVSRSWRHFCRSEGVLRCKVDLLTMCFFPAVWRLLYARDLAQRTLTTEHANLMLQIFAEQCVPFACDPVEARSHVVQKVLPFLPIAFGLKGDYRLLEELPHCHPHFFANSGHEIAYARPYQEELNQLEHAPARFDPQAPILEPESVSFAKLTPWPFGLFRVWRRRTPTAMPKAETKTVAKKKGLSMRMRVLGFEESPPASAQSSKQSKNTSYTSYDGSEATTKCDLDLEPHSNGSSTHEGQPQFFPLTNMASVSSSQTASPSVSLSIAEHTETEHTHEHTHEHTLDIGLGLGLDIRDEDRETKTDRDTDTQRDTQREAKRETESDTDHITLHVREALSLDLSDLGSSHADSKESKRSDTQTQTHPRAMVVDVKEPLSGSVSVSAPHSPSLSLAQAALSLSPSTANTPTHANSSANTDPAADTNTDTNTNASWLQKRGELRGSTVLLGPIAPTKARFIAEYRHRAGTRTLTRNLLCTAALSSWLPGAGVVYLVTFAPCFMAVVFALLALTLNARDGQSLAVDFNRDRLLYALVAPYGLFIVSTLPGCLPMPLWWLFNRFKPIDNTQPMPLWRRFLYPCFGDPQDTALCLGAPLLAIGMNAVVVCALAEYFWPLPFAGHITALVLLGLCLAAFVSALGYLVFETALLMWRTPRRQQRKALCWFLSYQLSGIASGLLPYIHVCGVSLLWSVQILPLLINHCLLIGALLTRFRRVPVSPGFPHFTDRGAAARLTLSASFFLLLGLQLDFPLHLRFNWLIVFAPLIVLLPSAAVYGLQLGGAVTNSLFSRVRLTGLRNAWSDANLPLDIRHHLHRWRSYLLQVKHHRCGCVAEDPLRL